jgi:pyruvate dehydrogenase E2 component (dihydrolipoamide acetyltransferase)
MPALSPTMTEGNLAKWLKSEGDNIKAGDVIAEIETDKATMEVEAVDEGVLKKILIQQGIENVPVNSVIAVLLEEGESADGLDEFISKIVVPAPAATASAPEMSAAPAATSAPASAEPPKPMNLGSRVFASPLAKRIAAMEGISLNMVQGSGPHGRIVKADVLAAASAPRGRVMRNAEEFNLVPNNNMRKVIAKRLLESKNTVPHFYLNIDCQMDALLEAREHLNNKHAEDKSKRVSVNDFIILAVAKALKDVPEANSSWTDEAIRLYNNVDVAVAVAIDGGLVTPIIRNADQKDIIKISAEMKELAQRAREGKLMPEEYQGGGFSISNLGMFGIKSFNAIINPPQSCILAIGQSVKKPVVNNDKIEIATVMEVNLSCDHRVVDGAVGARFLTAFKRYIEAPILMFL